MKDFVQEIKTTRIDERGRITIPKEFRMFFPDKTQVTWRFVGDKLIVNFENAENVEFLTDEFLQNQILDLWKEIKELQYSIKELRTLAFRKLMAGPDGKTPE